MILLLVSVLGGAIRAGTAVLFAVLGEIVGQRTGVISMGCEGSMLVGALTGFAVAYGTGHPWLGALMAGLAASVLGLIHAYMVLQRRASQLATGLALYIFGGGVTAFFGRSWVGKTITPIDSFAVPGLAEIPVLGPILFQHDPLVYIAIVMAPAIWYFLYRTRPGLVLRATGERDEVVHACGYAPMPVRYGAVAFAAFMAGVGGAQISVAYTTNWFGGMTSGQGFVAIALVIFSGWSPLRAVFGAYLFGGALALQLFLQARGVGVSPFLLSMVPYLLTLLVLLLVGQRRHAVPEGLRAVFEGTGDWFKSVVEGSVTRKGDSK